MTHLKRSSGLLLHPTSFAGPFGIGEISSEAYKWIDFLVAAKQSIWQILPLGPTGYGNSPYQTASVFAGNPLMIDPIRLASEGYISESDLQNAPSFPVERVDFESVIDWKMPLLLNAYSQLKADSPDAKSFEKFCQKHDERWLHEFARFMAIKAYHDKIAWWDWPDAHKLRQKKAMTAIEKELHHEIMAHKFLQFQFFKQWNDLKRYANQNGIQIMGDIPIYVASDSAEVWANQSSFYLDETGNPTVVAGVPPDHFSEYGQLWGNPIYRWDVMAKNDFKWWCERVEVTMECVDLLRFDHFRGFEAYWAVPFGEETAVNGEWIKGPGRALFDALKENVGDIPIIAEDLGFITPGVLALRDHYNFPGMKILQFAFHGDPEEPFLPHNFDKNCIAYSGSHDNDTTRGWFEKAHDGEKYNLQRYLNKEVTELDAAWELIRLGSASTAVSCVFPVQDVLNLGSDARMNTPGRPSGNWGWRLTKGELTEQHQERLALYAEIYGRAPMPEEDEDPEEE